MHFSIAHFDAVKSFVYWTVALGFSVPNLCVRAESSAAGDSQLFHHRGFHSCEDLLRCYDLKSVLIVSDSNRGRALSVYRQWGDHDLEWARQW